MHNSGRRTFSSTTNSLTDIRTQHVRNEADKILEKRIKELTERLQGSDNKLERHKEYLRELAEEKTRRQMIRNRNREENVERQKRKNEYKKRQLTAAQQQQDEKLQKIYEVKRSMLLQSKCIKLANDMRKYHLKKEIERNKGQYITVDRLMGINEKYGSGAGIRLSIDMPENEARKKIVELLGISLSAPGRKTSAKQREFSRFSNNRLSAPRNSDSL